VIGFQLPKNGKLEYGQSIALSFVVKDAVTGKAVAAVGDANAFLVLKRQDKNGAWQVSTRIPAVAGEEVGKFSISWVVNPNADKGKGVLELVAQGADGKDFALVDANGAHWRLDVSVGGDIRVEDSSYAKAVIDPRSSDEYALMFVNFQLFSGEKSLSGARLVARVLSSEQKLMTVEPVTEGISSEGENFGYQASWSLTDAPPGTYTVEFFREADRPRMGTVDPFFQLKLKYDGSSASFLPLRTEFLVIVLIAAAFGYAASRKMELSGSKKK